MYKNLKFYISNDIESLADHWISQSTYYKDVFKPHIILTQTQGMNNWLKLRRVHNTGNSTNILFITPNDFLLKIYNVIHLNNSIKISNKHIDWLIYKILSTKDFQKKYPFIFNYYKNEDNSINELKQWSLAYSVADLLDQYQIYRQDILREWLVENDDEINNAFGWQQYIWKALHDILGDKLIDLSKMQVDVIDLLNRADIQQKLKNEFEHISLFGISILSPYHIQMLYKLSEIIHVDFYLLNPAPDVYWDLDKSQKDLARQSHLKEQNQGHELLTNWGKVIQSTFKLLHSDDTIFNNSEILPIKPIDNSTLLKTIQTSIHNNEISFLNLSNNIISDKSIEICSHYNIYNETVGLLNYIINMTQKNPNIKDSDILVICSDINKYAPYIRSVFNNNSFNIKITISDEQLYHNDSIITTLIDILTFNFSEFKINDVFELLEHHSLRKKFDINDLDRLKSIVEKLNIKYGYKNSADDDTHLVSWAHGMKKCLLNICMTDITLLNINSEEFHITDLIDDNPSIYLINQFFELIDQLNNLKSRTNQGKTLSEWKAYIDDVIQKLIYSDDENQLEEYEDIIKQMNQLETIDEIINYEQIPFQVFSHRLSIVLQKLNNENKFLKKGITFCSPIPFRSVPFKVIAFIGLNAKDFPRMQPENSINYINHQPRIGDRNIKDNDKHLFLESLLAANDYFYLSYIGRNATDNSPLSPSILIEELLDYIQSQTDLEIPVRSHLITEYPLNIYSHKFNKSGSNLNPNYLIKNESKRISILKEEINETKNDEIQWKKIVDFFINPAQYYFNNKRKIYFDAVADSDVYDSYEKIILNNKLELSQHKQLIIKNKLLYGIEPNETMHLAYIDGHLPLRNVGALYAQGLIVECDTLVSNIETVTSNEQKKNINCNLEYDTSNIFYATEMFGEKCITYSTSKMDLRHKLRAFLSQIFLKKCGLDSTQYIFDLKETVQLDIISDEEAYTWFELLFSYYQKYHELPLPLDSHLAQKIVDKPLDNLYVQITSNKYNNYNKYFKHIVDHYPIQEYLPIIEDLIDNIYQPIIEKFDNINLSHE